MRQRVAAVLLALLPFVASADFGRSDYGQAFADIVTALREKDFARLERMHQRFMQPDARAADGTWMIQAFQEAFESRFRFEPPASTEKLFAEWRERAPESALRPIAEAIAWQRRAWIAKGTSCYARSASSSRKAFNDLVARAADALREGEAAGVASPLWHTAAMLVGGAQGRPAAELDALLDAGAQRFPTYVPLFAARMTFLLPEWGGDPEALDRFIRASAERSGEREGRAMYAWLYVEIARAHDCEGLFDRSEVTWPDMRAAFDDMLEHHPDTWNRNVYATFACRARDRETTARLLGELGSDANLGIGSRGISTEGCLKMVRPKPEPQREM